MKNENDNRKVIDNSNSTNLTYTAEINLIMLSTTIQHISFTVPTNIQSHTCVHIHTHVDMHICIAYTPTYIHINTHPHFHINIRTYTTYTHIHTHIYTCMYIHRCVYKKFISQYSCENFK